MIYLPAKVRDDWHRYTGQERTPSPDKWNRAVKGVVLKALHQIEAGCIQNEHGKLLRSLVDKFTDDQMRMYHFHRYTTDVQACLNLFPIDKYVVFIQRNPNFCGVNIRCVSDINTIAAKAEGQTIEIALLKACWHMHPD